MGKSYTIVISEERLSELQSNLTTLKGVYTLNGKHEFAKLILQLQEYIQNAIVEDDNGN